MYYAFFTSQIIPAESDNMGTTVVGEVYISFKSSTPSTVLAARLLSKWSLSLETK